MWVNRPPMILRTPQALLGSLPSVLGTPQALLAGYRRPLSLNQLRQYNPNRGWCNDSTMGAVSGQASGAVGGAAMGAKAGSIVGPIGTGVGAAIGAIAGAILGGHADHAQIARDVQGRKQLFSDYLTVAGTVPGRAIGIERLRDIWKGAGHMGHFPGWQGREQYIDGAVNGWPTTLKDWQATHTVSAPQSMQQTTPPRMVSMRAGAGRAMLAGLGDYSEPLTAKSLVDEAWWPGNAWAKGTDAAGMQVIYDSADAFLASIDPSIPPYIPSAPAPQQAVSGPVQQVAVPVAAPAPVITPTPSVVPTQSPPTPQPTAVVPVPATPAGGPDISALINQLMNQGMSGQQAYGSAMSSLQAAGVQPTDGMQQQAAQAVQQAGVGTGVPGWLWLVLIGGGAIFALARPERGKA